MKFATIYVFSILICAVLAAFYVNTNIIEEPTPKPSIVIFSATWCGPCQRLHRDLEQNPNLKKYVEEELEKVYQYNVETMEGSKLYSDYKMDRNNGVPAIAFGYINNQNQIEITHRIYGYSDPDSFIQILKDSKNGK